jgi:hypothetical protein
MKIRPVGTDLFHADRRTDGQTDMTKLIVAFCSFASAPKTLKYSVNTQVFHMSHVLHVHHFGNTTAVSTLGRFVPYIP